MRPVRMQSKIDPQLPMTVLDFAPLLNVHPLSTLAQS